MNEKNRLQVIFALFMGALSLTTFANSGFAAATEEKCLLVYATMEEEALSDEPVITTGKLRGNLTGDYYFELQDILPIENSTKAFYRAKSSISTKRGKIFLSDTGVIDTVSPGYLSALASVNGGTGKYKYASGQLHYYGNFDTKTGKGAAEFRGIICTPHPHYPHWITE
ncbi:MAG: hypothetical protein L0H75_09840 [Nitrosospira sp.]|nr:hypothetical protein [Nitrosospira sp.]